MITDLQGTCAEWQRILKLQDWDISSVKIVSSREMGNLTQTGSISWDIAHMVASIKLISPEDYPGDAAQFFPYSMEETLVHELLHLRFAGFDVDSDSPEGLAQEQAINALAHALVTLKNANIPTQG
jgi:hypothetical protein